MLIDSLDQDRAMQPTVELALQSFCLNPFDVILCRAVLTANPIQNADKLAEWRETTLLPDKPSSVAPPCFMSAWNMPKRSEMLLNAQAAAAINLR